MTGAPVDASTAIRKRSPVARTITHPQGCAKPGNTTQVIDPGFDRAVAAASGIDVRRTEDIPIARDRHPDPFPIGNVALASASSSTSAGAASTTA